MPRTPSTTLQAACAIFPDKRICLSRLWRHVGSVYCAQVSSSESGRHSIRKEQQVQSIDRRVSVSNFGRKKPKSMWRTNSRGGGTCECTLRHVWWIARLLRVLSKTETQEIKNKNLSHPISMVSETRHRRCVISQDPYLCRVRTLSSLKQVSLSRLGRTGQETIENTH